MEKPKDRGWIWNSQSGSHPLLSRRAAPAPSGQVFDVVGINQGARVWEQALFQAAQEHQRKFQTLGGMQGHERDLCPGHVLIGVADQGGVVEELVQGLATIARIHGRIHQFADVLNPGKRFGRVLFFELANVTSAVNQEFQDFSGAGWPAGVTG